MNIMHAHVNLNRQSDTHYSSNTCKANLTVMGCVFGGCCCLQMMSSWKCPSDFGVHGQFCHNCESGRKQQRWSFMSDFMNKSQCLIRD